MHQKSNKTQVMVDRLKLGAMLAVGLFMVVGVAFPQAPKSVQAAVASCSTITECNNEIASNNDAVNDLQNQAVSYQDAIARLNNQISSIQHQISYNVAKQADLQKQITQKEAEIAHQREVLGADLKAMYVDDQMSTIEMLATSKNLSDYVDKEEYRTAVQNQIQETLVQIAALQKELESQKVQVETLIQDQRAQQSRLASARAEQSRLLTYNQSQQDSFNAQTAANKSKLASLIAAQRAANQSSSPGGYYFLRFPGAKHGFSPSSYPYRNSGFSMSTAPGCNDGDGPDRWGYCTRQCVSYAAWAVEASGRKAPMYYGSAKYWIYSARRDGVPIYSNPQPGDIAISTHGTWGHAMYVEAVSGDSIYVSQYNQQLSGEFSYQWRAYR